METCKPSPATVEMNSPGPGARAFSTTGFSTRALFDFEPRTGHCGDCQRIVTKLSFSCIHKSRLRCERGSYARSVIRIFALLGKLRGVRRLDWRGQAAHSPGRIYSYEYAAGRSP